MLWKNLIKKLSVDLYLDFETALVLLIFTDVTKRTGPRILILFNENLSNVNEM